MDKYSYLVELNNFLDYKFAGTGAVSGDSCGIHFVVYFSEENRLTATASVRLFGDLPFRDHIDGAFKKLSFFYSYSLEEDRIELFSNEIKDNDSALNLSEDITLFAKTLTELGYKDSDAQRERAEKTEAEEQAYQEALGIVPIHKEPDAVPPRTLFGIFGALLGAAGSLILFIGLGYLDYLWPYVLGAVIVVLAPPVCYELLTKQKTSAVQIVICLFLSVVVLLLGDRIIWTLGLMNTYHDIDFEIAYFEIPYLVEDGFVEASDYYRGYFIMLVPLVIFYFIFIWNYLRGGKSILQVMTAKRKI